MQTQLNRLRESISKAPQWVTVVFAALVTFSVYTCMYGYRKAFTAAGFEDQSLLGVDYKIWLVTAQVIGYMFSKFYGIKFIAEHISSNRATIILKLIFAAWMALLGFALVPAPYNILFLFLNGFPLGMIWGLVFSYVEGRRATELMGAVLASSFIFASGFAKSIGAWLMNDLQVTDRWMPFVAGAIYFIPLLIFTTLLQSIPAPTAKDIESRSIRLSMNATQRKEVIRQFLPGLFLLIVSYILLTILRDFRDNFANEILKELGLGGKASIFTKTEIPVAIIVLVLISSLMLVKNNFKAFYLNHLIILGGWLIASGATLLFMYQFITPFAWFTAVGTGLYLGYIPINCLYFDRMIASFRLTANVGFVMYVADSFGYLGSVLVLFVKQFSGLQLSWTNFFTLAILSSAAISTLCLLGALFFYQRKYRAFTQNSIL